MKIEYDPAKRHTTLENRGLDMADAAEIFEGVHITFPDMRFDYGEDRFLTIGYLRSRMIILAWTLRGAAPRIISMRKANEREKRRYRPRLDGPG